MSLLRQHGNNLLKAIEQSRWAKKFRQSFPGDYPRALFLAHRKSARFQIVTVNTLLGNILWGLAVKEKSNLFYMETSDSKDDLIRLCQKMNWILICDRCSQTVKAFQMTILGDLECLCDEHLTLGFESG